MRPTKRQKLLLDFITKYTAKNGISPSYREIGRALGYTSTSTVALHVDSLIERGYLQKRPNMARSLEAMGTDELAVLKRAEKVCKRATDKERRVLIKAFVIMGYYTVAHKCEQIANARAER